MKAVGLEEFRLAHGRWPDINAAVEPPLNFDTWRVAGR
jgi:hypothetical protein